MFINSNLLHFVVAFYSDFVSSCEMLYDDVCHVLPVRVPLSIQAVYSTEHYLVTPQRTILTGNCLDIKVSVSI